MSIKVLVVDDSGFFRRRIVEILNGVPGITVVGTASNGREAIEQARALKPDVITMDYEMPLMDGISAVRAIMQEQPTPVLMFSSLTHEGARVTLDALEAGAIDYLPKQFEDIARDNQGIQKTLADKIRAVARARYRLRSPSGPAAPATTDRQARQATGARPTTATQRTTRPQGAKDSPERVAVRKTPAASSTGKKTARQSFALVAIGTSTGGPVALQNVLTPLPANFPAPIVLVQHMPASFTPAFAERLNRLCKIQVKQAEHGEQLRAGVAYLAPGGLQMMIERSGSHGKIVIRDGGDRLHYKPCVDVTFGSIARAYPGKALGIILTGMGADGKDGCRLMKQTGCPIWAQDEETSVIYGMPMAVAKAGLTDEILPLDQIAQRLVETVA
ncbi:chemotaxis response regulator protein-glutamate methylesterase [Hahella sp. SMD15-11]|uniref:Protein-glutamate methylesterase/protein-glutamine glutaminase n=1 Tax=Thermohahella caldifontis TaxID=3142973 RepID=A0AB39UXU8_9GAMM